ncbi:Neuropeptide-Like Protein [Caenorhabditis elegans]|uniref:Neuropeptide-Like Protein n=2 Tax=Caenorhabditis elegans TaxID=6239 RepID=G4S3A8_CAEEL|nr:Neuropeptide-Like Protein [Caenorhabditis elegans]CCD65783.1 Neuropeptide-Like Protein [Caenorhabditis elegans]|eukprot:NP_001256091.1 Uncharacterized protein CELE_ZK742.7 [Caenorhabditis elegans]
MVAITRRSGTTMWWVAPILLIFAFTTVADSMSIPLREMILQWSESAPQMMPRGYQRSSRSFNMGPDVVHEKPRPLRFG